MNISIKIWNPGGAAPPQTPLHFRGAPPLELPFAKGCRARLGTKPFLENVQKLMNMVIWEIVSLMVYMRPPGCV